jgi:PAS domain S-box-containing protein
MLNNSEKKILTSIKFFPIIIIIVFSVILTYTFISQNNRIFKEDSKRIKTEFIQEHKNLVKKDVQLVYDLVEYEQKNALKKLKQNIQNKVQEAHKVVSSIYKENSYLDKDLILDKIRDALRHIRFNEGRGYYFIYELDGTNILFPTLRHLEGENFWDLKDIKNNFTIRELSNIAKNKKSGFYTWYWHKPNRYDIMYEKIGYTMLFEPLDIFIGTGEYVVDFEKELKKSVLNRISQIKYDKSGYVFIINYDGVFVNHIKKSLVNTNQLELKDKNGFSLTKEIIKTAKRSEGFVEYMGIPGTKEGEATKKISYIKGFHDWKWAIGSGFYPEDIKHLLKEKERKLSDLTEFTLVKISMISIITTIITIVLLFIFSDIIKKIFMRYRRRNREFQIRLKELLDDKTKELSESMEMTNSYVAMTKTDLNGIITYASDRFCKCVGYKKSELIGKSHSIVRHPDNDKSIYKKMWKTIQAGDAYKETMKNLTKDGDTFWFDVLIYPEYDKNKKNIGYTALRIDITDKKRIEKINKNLETEIKRAVESNREKDYALSQQSKMAAMGEMLENIAHQWRQPLSIISTAASGMKLQKDFKQLDDEHFYKSINSILSNTKHLSETINTFRDFFKSDKEKKLMDLETIFSKTQELIHSKYNNSDIQIISNTQKVELIGLETDLIQVLMNILNNAKDALDSVNKLEKKYLFVDISKDKYHALIKIKDNAGGIPLDIINKIFDPYFTTKHKAQGTGIGLYMSTEIISKHMNGNLSVQNQKYTYEEIPHEGAEFTIKLPLVEKKYLSEEIIVKLAEFNCYKWDKNKEIFEKIEFSNDKLVLKNIHEISDLLYQYNIQFKLLENQNIQVYFND